jgi:hypothetical protein
MSFHGFNSGRHARLSAHLQSLLLLVELTKSNPAIQKIVAFENAFERLFAVAAEEGHSDGGIIVEDCLRLAFNLLKDNDSNMVYFRETRCGTQCKPLRARFLHCAC